MIKMTLQSDRNFVLDYLDRLHTEIDALENYYINEILELRNILLDARLKRKRVFICGNGGSSAIASHIAQDLVKMCKINATSLTDNIPLVTAISNDNNYAYIFTDQLKRLSTKGDILIVLSGSGNSYNIKNTLITFDGLKKIAIVGTNGGDILENAGIWDINPVIHIEDDMQKSEDLFLAVLHIVVQMLSEDYGKEDK